MRWITRIGELLWRRTWSASVFAWFPDGRIQRISPSDNGIYYQSNIHPDGSHVVFFGNSIGQPPRIWKANLSNGDVIALTPPDSSARHPTFSWEGLHIAFSSDRVSGQEAERIEQMGRNGLPPAGHVSNLFVMNADGQNIRQVTSGPYQDQRPSFSPDGKTLVFVSNREGDAMQLWSVPVDNSAAPERLQSHGWGYRPWFSTDGQWVFFFTDINGRHQICKIPAEGGEISPLRNDDRGMSHGPFADPSGQYLLMHSTRDAKWMRIWQLPFDGSPPVLMQPPGFKVATHPTRAKNGVIAFDVGRGATSVLAVTLSVSKRIVRRILIVILTPLIRWQRRKRSK